MIDPKFLIIRILQACDANCFMCDFQLSKDTFRWSVREAERTAESAVNAGITHVRLTGGEPLLHEHIEEIVKALASAGLVVSIITNGSSLDQKVYQLYQNGLRQIIISIDGIGESHDKFRRTPGLFEAIKRGLHAIEKLDGELRLRANSVIGPHNFEQLIDLHKFLSRYGFDDWSIIPLKLPEGPWLNKSTEKMTNFHKEFSEYLRQNPGTRLLGDSAEWIGRTPSERSEYLSGQKVMTPRTLCKVPSLVRYYIPAKQQLHFCNCVPHRPDHRLFRQPWSPDLPDAWTFHDEAAWLEKFGPETCKGCEPLNAALGEDRIDMNVDPFGF